MRPVRGAAFVAAAVLMAATFTGAAFASTAKISFVDVGQGDGVVMRIGSKIVVSDAGQFKYGNIDAALHALGAKQVDVAILSHPHSDHDTDFLSLFDEWKVKKAVMSESAYWNGDTVNKAVLAAIKHEGLTPTILHAGQTFSWGGASWLILNPEEGLFTGGANEAADSSVAYLLRVNGAAALFTGDIDTSVSKDVAVRLPSLEGRLDIFLVTHHGSRYATPNALLDVARPRYAVLSTGPNQFGHPTPETIARLKDVPSTIWCTDVNGTITATISSSGQVTWSATGQKTPWWSATTKKETGSCVDQ
jgi:competence protein ComEC